MSFSLKAWSEMAIPGSFTMAVRTSTLESPPQPFVELS